MAIDWGEVLAKQASLARQMSQKVLVALAGSSLTLEQVSEIDASVRRCAADFDRIAAAVGGQGSDRSAAAKAEAIRDMWSNLCEIAADRLRLAQAANELDTDPLHRDKQA